MSQITKKDIDEIWLNYKNALKELEDFEFKSNTSKKEIVIRLRDSVRLLQQNEKISIDTSQISSYVWNVLLERGITYDYGHFIEVFAEDEKRNYSKSSDSLLSHEHQFIKDGNIEKCGCKAIKHNGILYDQVTEPKKQEPEKLKEQKHKPTPHEELIIRMLANLGGLSKICESLLRKYGDSNVRMGIEYVFKDTPKLIKEEKEHEATIIALNKELDYRQKIGLFSKIKAVLLDKCEYNTAKVAKLLQITPKHMAANIIRREFPELHENTKKWFGCIDIEIEGKKKIIDIGAWFDRQYIRGQLGLDIKKPFIIDYEAN